MDNHKLRGGEAATPEEVDREERLYEGSSPHQGTDQLEYLVDSLASSTR